MYFMGKNTTKEICAKVCVWRRQWHPTPVLLPGKSHGWRSLVGCSPRGRYQSDTTEWLHFLFSFSCIGEGNGNPLQCSCLESPSDGGVWWLPFMGLHRVGHNWSDLAVVATVCVLSHFSHVCVFAALSTVACHTSLPMEFSRPEEIQYT